MTKFEAMYMLSLIRVWTLKTPLNTNVPSDVCVIIKGRINL